MDNKSLLWRISGNGLARPSYLFGTIHMLCPSDYFWTAAMQKSLLRCKEVCFEMDMDDPAVLSEAASGMAGAPGRQLKDYFTPEQYSRLARFAKDTLGTDLSGLQQVSPVILQTLFMAKTVDCMMPVSYEANIMEEAQKQHKEIVGLEAVKEQMDVLRSLPDDSVVNGLMQLTDSFAASKIQYRKMIAAYKAQDLPELYRQITSSRELGDDMGAFLDDRNKKWIPRMAAMMKSGPVFFAVGAGHLPGELGVIGLLRAAGYLVEAVR
jgi:uncharacterized protein YbaP (TraB family)